MKKLLYATLSAPLLLGALACENRGAGEGEAVDENRGMIEEREQEGIGEEQGVFEEGAQEAQEGAQEAQQELGLDEEQEFGGDEEAF